MKKLYKIIASSSIALVLLLVFGVAMAVATFIENDYGTTTAWVVIYDSWWFELVMLGLCISFIANIFKYRLYQQKKWAILVFHIAFVITIIGAGITRYTSYGGMMRIREGATSDVMISDTQFLNMTITDGKTTKTIKEKLKFASIRNNKFNIKTEFQGKPIQVSYKDFIPDAVAQVVEDSITGEPMLEFVITIDKLRQNVYLSKGTTKKLTKEVSIGFDTDKATIQFYQVDGQLKAKSEKVLDFFIMASQQAGKLAKDTLNPISLNTMYRIGDVSIVPMTSYKHGKFKLISEAKRLTENDKRKDDAVIVDVKVGKEHKTVNLLYREGYLPSHHPTELNGLKVTLSYGSEGIKLPFKIRLDDFQLERYPGSSSPSAYTSEVTIIDDKEEHPYRIFMNNVLDYKGYRFFQASYDTDEKGTVLTVNHDRLGTAMTYLGYLLMGIGMFFTLFSEGSRFQYINKQLKKVKKQQLTLLMLLFISFSNGQQTKDYVGDLFKTLEVEPEISNRFGRLMVQDLDGRIKPINTLASEFVRKISRKTYFTYPTKDKTVYLNVNQFFLSLHLYPNYWQKIPIIKADFDKLGNVLKDIPNQKSGMISFAGLIGKNGQSRLKKYVEEANKKTPAERTEFDKEVLKVDERFNILYNLFTGTYLKIFPKRGDENHNWYSYTHHFKDFENEDALFAKSILPLVFKDLAEKKYNEAYDKMVYIEKYQNVLAKEIIPSQKRIEAELWYNKLNINFWLFQALFTIGGLMLLLTIIKMFKSRKWLSYALDLCVISSLICFLIFTANILLRWYVSQHAPWSNGYEMLVFSSWILLLSGIISFRKSDFALPLATLFTGALLLVSYLDWISPEITNLMPVLKSYWLKVHVATIISGYAPLALSAVLGTTSLLMLIFKTDKSKEILDLKIKELTYVNEMAMTIGLFLLTIGTFLGGVWANESWGRYWAWDPKETWALISIIVYSIVLHLRLVPKLNDMFVLNVASMFAFWSIIMTSFGVNYYLAGLHSYASGDPVPIPTFVYYVFGLMVVIAVGAYFKWRKNN